MKCTVLEVIKYRLDFPSHTLPKTLTKLDTRQLLQPINCSIIDSLSDIKTTIKPTMIRPSKHDHYLPCPMLYSTNFHLWVFSFQELRFYKKSFMSKKLGTLTWLLFIVLSSLLLQEMAVLLGYWIPNFRGTLMDIVDGCQIEIFLVPTKESFPWTNITVRFSNTLHLLCKSILQ